MFSSYNLFSDLEFVIVDLVLVLSSDLSESFSELLIKIISKTSFGEIEKFKVLLVDNCKFAASITAFNGLFQL